MTLVVLLAIPPAIAAPRWLAKEEGKQNTLILHPLLLTSEEIRSYLGAGFWFVFD
jgi:hypothetical protein